MIKLKRVTIHKFKCVESDQTFDVEPDVTVLVGMNESGKTSILQAMAKTKYFENDPVFKFNTTHDYPRKEKKQVDKSGVIPKAVTCMFEISPDLINRIANDIGQEVCKCNEFNISYKYDNWAIWTNPEVSFESFITQKMAEGGTASKTLQDKLIAVRSAEGLQSIIDGYQDEKIKSKLNAIKKYFENAWEWKSNPLSEYVARVHLSPHVPKFLYYDEYYALPSRISIEKLQNETLDGEELKTAKALFELADININEVLQADNFENFKAELEATESTITQELFRYWSTNTNLEIQFDIDKIEGTHPQKGTQIIEHVLDIRVRNNRTKMSLPLRNRSKGFNWFFSFLVWFKKIQEDSKSNYILLLDEPGLNLHAAAQQDLLSFIEDLSSDYQIIYTTHSPFMVNTQKLHRVRTILETEEGSRISDSVQEKDPNTLFPLQAALGYDIAQNLFISKYNLLVEGVSDLIYLQSFSGILASKNRTGLRDDMSIVPVGGLEKVSTFVSLLRGNNLDIVCLLDTSIDRGSQAHLKSLIASKIIKQSRILQFNSFTGNDSEADIEDMFEKEEYLKLFNSAFPEFRDLNINDLNSDIDRIVLQIDKALEIERFNHYRPAREFNRFNDAISDKTLDRFESLFKKVNEIFR